MFEGKCSLMRRDLNLFVLGYDGCGFLDLHLCFLQLSPEDFLQLRRSQIHNKNTQSVNVIQTCKSSMSFCSSGAAENQQEVIKAVL